METDLPADVPTRDKVLLAAMGSPDRRQIDGLGGANPLTSKVGIVRRSLTEGVHLDFLFAQVVVDKALVDTTPNCGNMLAAVVPFALERGLVKPQGDTTTLRVLTLNTDMKCDVTATRASTVCRERQRPSPSTSSRPRVRSLQACCPRAACSTR